MTIPSLGAAGNEEEELNGSGGDVTLSAPSGTGASDLWLTVAAQVNGSDAPSPATGHTELDAPGDFADGVWHSAHYRIGPNGVGTFATPGGDSFSGGRSFRLTDIDTSTPISGTPIVGVTSGTNSATLPAYTTAHADVLIVYIAFVTSTGRINSTVGGATKHNDFFNLGGGDIATCAFVGRATAGTEAAKTLTWSGGSSSVNYVVAGFKGVASAASDQLIGKTGLLSVEGGTLSIVTADGIDQVFP